MSAVMPAPQQRFMPAMAVMAVIAVVAVVETSETMPTTDEQQQQLSPPAIGVCTPGMVMPGGVGDGPPCTGAGAYGVGPVMGP
jgi:hypothetical protein